MFSPDRKFVATIDWVASGRIWNSVTGALVCRLIGHQDRVLGIAFSPDGKLLATSSRDTNVRLWAADPRVTGDAYPCEPCGADDEVLELAKKRVTRKLTPYEEQPYLGKSFNR